LTLWPSPDHKRGGANLRRRRAANLRRKLAMLRFHAEHCGPDGKSTVAVKGGQVAAAKRIANTPGGARALGLELALARWHPGGGAS
jgi:hypothetical protein